jgi:hypothetical protein
VGRGLDGSGVISERAGRDDLDLEVDGTGQPVVTAILVGPGALGPRLGGRLGGWVVAIGRRLAVRPDGSPPRIDVGLVSTVGSAVTLAVPRRDLSVAALEDWVRQHVIDPLPGASDANE